VFVDSEQQKELISGCVSAGPRAVEGCTRSPVPPPGALPLSVGLHGASAQGMPAGNGDTGALAWVERGGDLVLYLSKVAMGGRIIQMLLSTILFHP
jgi:hypothetical protein